MATVTPSTTTGRALYEGSQSFRTHDDFCDSKRSGAYYHKASEFSATELEEILDALRFLMGVVRSGAGSVPVRNQTGAWLGAGTLVYLDGYSVANSSWLVSLADKSTNLAEFVLLNALDVNSNGYAYVGGSVAVSGFSGFSGAAGNLYLGTSGQLSTSAPTLPDKSQLVGFCSGYSGATNAAFRVSAPLVALLSDIQDVDVSGISDGYMLIWNATQSKWTVTPPTDTDEKVKTSSDDSSAGYLADKVDAVTITVNGSEKIQVGTITGTQIGA